ncbi:hypothetical protein [Microbacterium sp.]|uniref:hypothetical protein n=1 Tax=Microbacterium sp. TaxID=51671 RepID=UPI0035656B12
MTDRPAAADPNPVRSGRTSRIIGIVLTVIIGIPFALLVRVALSSRFGPASADPHGYGLIIGTVLALGLGLLLAVTVPLVFSPGRRGRAYLWSMLGYLAVAAGLIVALLTA